jgi:hypothetical protein
MSERGKFLRELNEAFARNDAGFIAGQVTDDIRWTIPGDRTIEGKESFLKALKEMAASEPMQLSISKIITHGRDAAVNGSMKMPDGKIFAFCDVYVFNGFKDAKIREMYSYVVELKNQNGVPVK